MSRPGRFTPGKDPLPIYRRLGGPQCRSGNVRKISPQTVIRSPDRRFGSWSLYRLSYPGPRSLHYDALISTVIFKKPLLHFITVGLKDRRLPCLLCVAFRELGSSSLYIRVRKLRCEILLSLLHILCRDSFRLIKSFVSFLSTRILDSIIFPAMSRDKIKWVRSKAYYIMVACIVCVF